jgi:hypothetical protein
LIATFPALEVVVAEERPRWSRRRRAAEDPVLADVRRQRGVRAGDSAMAGADSVAVI